jgi:hypothetical protein
MAYSKQPKQSTQQQRRIPASGSMVPTNTVGQEEGAQFVNCAPVAYKRYGMDPLHVVEPRPFLIEDSFEEVGTGAGATNGVFIGGEDTNDIWVVRGDDLYKNGTLQQALSAANSSTVTCFCIAKDYLIYTRSGVFTDQMGKYPLGAGTFVETELGNSIRVVGAPVSLNGYVFVAGNDGNVYNSALNDPMSFNYATDFVAAEQYADSLVSLAKHRNHVVAFGNRSIEFFYDAVNALGSPLNRQENYAMQIGLVKLESISYTYFPVLPPPITEIKDVLFFLGQDQAGNMSIYAMDNFQVTDIADDNLKKLFQNSPEQGGVTRRDPRTGLLTTFRISPIRAFGNTCVYIEFSTEINATGTGRENHFRYVYNPSTGYWSRWDWEKLDSANGKYIMATSGYAAIGTFNQRDRIYGVFIDTSNRPHTGYFRSVTDGYAAESLLCEIQTGIQDFDSYYPKHFINADVLGYYDINTTSVGLETTKHTNYGSYVDRGWKTGNMLSDGVARFKNLGVARHMNFKVKISTTSNFQYHGLDVLFDQGLA